MERVDELDRAMARSPARTRPSCIWTFMLAAIFVIGIVVGAIALVAVLLALR